MQATVKQFTTYLFIAAHFLSAKESPSEQATSSATVTVSSEVVYAQVKRFSTFAISRKDLNKPISPYRIFINFATSGGLHGGPRMVRCTILRGEPLTDREEDNVRLLEKQLIPYSYTWKVSGSDGRVLRQWLCHFLQNRDLSYHTLIQLPEAELSRSQLEIYFEDLDGDGKRDDITFTIDLSKFDWTPTSGIVTQ